MGYSPWGHKESDRAERLRTQHTQSLKFYEDATLVTSNDIFTWCGRPQRCLSPNPITVIIYLMCKEICTLKI